MLDIQPKNILLGVSDNDAFKRFEQYEQEEPLPRKELPSRSIYTSRPMPPTKGVPSLSDLSEARVDDPKNDDLVMPDLYRAPEVILGFRGATVLTNGRLQWRCVILSSISRRHGVY